MNSEFNYIPDNATLPVAFAQLLYRYLDAQGAVLDDVLASERLQQADEPVAEFPARLFCDLLERASSLLDDPLLGLHLGQSFEPKLLGALGYVLATSDNILDAVQRLNQYHAMVYGFADFRLNNQQDNLVLEWTPTLTRHCSLLDDLGISCFVASYRSLTNSTAPFPRIDFVNPTPTQKQAYAEYFGGSVNFEQAATRIYIPQRYLSKPFAGRDPTLRNMLEKQLTNNSSNSPAISEIEKSVRREIIRLIYLEPPSVDTVAANLRLSTRQLRYLLKQQDLNFRKLHNEIFRTLAEMHLSDANLTIQQVSNLFNYSEQSAFCRAFQKLTDESPSNYRKRLFRDSSPA